MTKLNISTQGAALDPRYTLDMIQVRILAVAPNLANLQASPKCPRAWGSEEAQPHWLVETHPVCEPATAPRKGHCMGQLWMYMRNYRDGEFKRGAAEDFESRPAVSYGLAELPVLRVEMATHWSSMPKDGE